MDIYINDSMGFAISEELNKIVENIIEEALKLENYSLDAEISISLVDNREIQRLNKKFRKLDKPTDVLSFPADDTQFLGDIIISMEKVEEQAKDYGHSFEREFGFMIAHSMLHLMGYDHMNETEEKIMFAKQDEILAKASLFR